MRIYFENWHYRTDQIKPYLVGIKVLNDSDKNESWTDRVGYLFVCNDSYKGPVFILPQAFLIKESKDTFNVLGMTGIYPQDVIDTENEENPLELDGRGSFLPELGLWIFRSLQRFYHENMGTAIAEKAGLDSQLPEDGARDKDFLSTALELIDFLDDHRNLFTQITLINHSGNDKIDWPKTVEGNPFIENGESWYFDPAIKDKSIDIDDTLLKLYFSVLKYLHDKYRFPVKLDEVRYELYTTSEIQYMIDDGIGKKKLAQIRHKYYRDDLRHLWKLLDTFFDNNISDDHKEQRKERLLVRSYYTVFEKMIDRLLSDERGIDELKKQDDGKLIDHIFRHTSLLDKSKDIYYIGDSKYYQDDHKPEGTALYKQFTYAKNTIQYHIDNCYLSNKKKKDNLFIRDESIADGYNITPNFFIRGRITESDIDFEKPALDMTYWNQKAGQEFPKPNMHFKDRLFDRDTLLLREFKVNLLFVVAAYAGFEEGYWASEMHKTIRDAFIASVDKEYEFFMLTPDVMMPEKFFMLHFEYLKGKVISLESHPGSFLLAFEKSATGAADKQKFLDFKLKDTDTGEPVTYEMTPVTLAQLSTE